MGRGSSGAGGGTGAGGGGGNIPTNAVNLTNQDAQDLRDLQDSQYDASTTAAVKMYISNTNFDNQGHSLSQTMNYLEANGVDLANANLNQINQTYGLSLSPSDLASMQYTSAYMDRAVHPLGKDVNLQRGAHDDMLRDVFGISNYARLSQQQLQSRLVGQTFRNTSYMSTSYDVTKNPFLSSKSGVSGGREIVYSIKAGKNTKALFGAKAQSEIIIGKGTDFKITGCHFSGNVATPRGGAAKPQLVIDIETY